MRKKVATMIRGYVLYRAQGGRETLRDYLNLCGAPEVWSEVEKIDLLKIWDMRDPYGHVAGIKKLVLQKAGFNPDDMERHWVPYYVGQMMALRSMSPEFGKQLDIAFRCQEQFLGAQYRLMRLKRVA